MARRKDHTRDQLKEMVVKAACGIAEAEGYEAATARRVAHEIGYAPGTIYNIFESMDALYLEVSSKTLDKLHAVLSDPACHRKDKSATENMKQMAHLYEDFSRAHRNLWLMLFTHTMPEEIVLPEWFQTKIEALFVPLESLLAQLMQIDPEGSEAQNLKLAARTLWASVHGLCFLEGTGKVPHPENQTNTYVMMDYLIDAFAKGVR